MKRLFNFYKKEEIHKHYELGAILGTGSFAEVKVAVSKSDKIEYAVKCIDKKSLDQDDQEALEMEVKILQQVNHSNIVELKEVFDCRDTYYMVMEKMTGGELFDRIVEKEKYTEGEARDEVKAVTGALLYCHDLGIVHRDLKPENLLYSSKDESESILKIADFGLAKLTKSDYAMQTACGTPGYVAPEILEGKAYASEVDIWSMGVITYILLCGFPPFYDDNNAKLFKMIKRGEFDYPSPYWDKVSDDAKDLINNMLQVDPKKRLTAKQVLEHRWVTESGAHHTTDLADGGYKTKLQESIGMRRKFKKGVMAVIASKRMAGGTLAAAAAGKSEADVDGAEKKMQENLQI